MPLVRITDRHNPPREFNGKLIAESSTKKPGDIRWVEFRLYRLDDGAGYISHRAGMSDIFHRQDTTCQTAQGRPSGDECTIEELPDSAVPCPVCRPKQPWNLADDDVIRYEFPRNTVDQAADPGPIIHKLSTKTDRRTRVTTTMASGPVADLLDQASQADQAWASAMTA